MEKKQPIIKKIIKKGHGGHHGGSWKVAFADFMTAMMAFFLVMWLLSISSEKGKEALAEYFDKLTISDAIFNGGLPTGSGPGADGPSVLDGGCYQLDMKAKELEEKENQLKQLMDHMEASGVKLKIKNENKGDYTYLPEGIEGGEGSDKAGSGGENSEITAKKEEFSKELEQSLKNNLGQETASQVYMEPVKGGLRLEITDKENHPLFLTGKVALTKEAQELLTVIAQKLNTIPNKISIEGHTDSVQTKDQQFSNWELSTARASAARVFLANHGVKDDRLVMVAGYGSSQPLDKDNPTDPINRRISIMIWDTQPPKVTAPKTAGANKNSETKPNNQNTPSAQHESNDSKKETESNPRNYEFQSIDQLPSIKQRSNNSLDPTELVQDTLDKAAKPQSSTAGPPVSTQNE